MIMGLVRAGRACANGSVVGGGCFGNGRGTRCRAGFGGEEEEGDLGGVERGGLSRAGTVVLLDFFC